MLTVYLSRDKRPQGKSIKKKRGEGNMCMFDRPRIAIASASFMANVERNFIALH